MTVEQREKDIHFFTEKQEKQIENYTIKTTKAIAIKEGEIVDRKVYTTETYKFKEDD